MTKSAKDRQPNAGQSKDRQQRQDARPTETRQQGDAALGDAGQGPSTTGTLASGYSGRSSVGGTGGDVLKQRGSGYSPGADSRTGSHANEDDPLASEGVTAGAAGMTPAGQRNDRTLHSGADDEADQATDGGAVVTGVGGVSGGGSGTTSSTNTRK